MVPTCVSRFETRQDITLCIGINNGIDNFCLCQALREAIGMDRVQLIRWLSIDHPLSEVSPRTTTSSDTDTESCGEPQSRYVVHRAQQGATVGRVTDQAVEHLFQSGFLEYRNRANKAGRWARGFRFCLAAIPRRSLLECRQAPMRWESTRKFHREFRCLPAGNSRV